MVKQQPLFELCGSLATGPGSNYEVIVRISLNTRSLLSFWECEEYAVKRGLERVMFAFPFIRAILKSLRSVLAAFTRSERFIHQKVAFLFKQECSATIEFWSSVFAPEFLLNNALRHAY